MDPANPFRALPSVDELLGAPRVRAACAGMPRELAAGFVQEVLAAWRERIRAEQPTAAEIERRIAAGELGAAIEARVARERRAGLCRAINASGVVLNTGLGRAPLHPEAAARMAEVAAGYSVLEVDRESGQRNQRDDRISALCARLFGCEAAIAVNNNAAAVTLVLAALARGREVVLSRGELVEIGGAFRMPAVMEMAGCVLREVGTTNRTRLSDYRDALGERTALLLRVHPSNFRVIGFTEEAEHEAVVALAHGRGLPAAWDLGSGLVEAGGAAPLEALGEEPTVRAALGAGYDVVTFSGDKLLGGPQAGIVVGKREWIARVRACPLYRALRLDKSQIAALEATLELLLAGRGDELPTRALLRMSAGETRARCEALVAQLAALGVRDGASGVALRIVECASQPGSGSAPDVYLPGFALELRVAGREGGALATALRLGEPPVFARVQDGALLVDPRTLLAGEDEALARALAAVVRG
ncbi:MAG: L-seryl-tRNA(Sec) selenium transferase [Planctomycetota bacterium]|nr:MAG: L-seryl-tRNA(Sec) selenium transferase [Planctomycetota bacterium]